MIEFKNIPGPLKDRRQWVLWQNVVRDGHATKVPFQSNHTPAKANDPKTWTTFETVRAVYLSHEYAGIGFEFSSDDGFCGIDLDGCRNPDTGEIAEWAEEILLGFSTYSEVSPSGTGVKLFVKAKLPFDRGRKKELPSVPRMGAKNPAIELYDQARYFAVTGERLNQYPTDPQDGQEALLALIGKYFAEPIPSAPRVDFRSNDAVVERARKYLAKIPPAMSGSGGHNQTFHAACVLVLGFELSEGDALGLLSEYNQKCQPPWSERELQHKVASAAKQPGERGYLRNVSPERWDSVKLPAYAAPVAQKSTRDEKPETRPPVLLVDAARSYLDVLRSGQDGLVEIGIPELDYAIGGGVSPGEMVIFAARPSHGKSAVAMQCVHEWTRRGMPCTVISEEMSAMALGKRTLQFLSPMPVDYWRDSVPALESELAEYASTRADCFVYESCGSALAAADAIEKSVKERGVRCAVVDYAQLLSSPGKSRYEQVTQTSIVLRQLASSQKIVLLVLCQLNRAIESRTTFKPLMSDLKETGQLEQDADVITFLCWPHRIDPSEPPKKYQFFICKNRNRAINKGSVFCEFDPSRQTVRDQVPEYHHGNGRIPE